MPTEHKKKKDKKEKKHIPKLLVKNEPSDVHPLSHYIDDRVELVRQIFTTMKSKTINSIRPDFLQDKSLEELQEICLDELLGISKKRLLSIINATKCPSDTESSDSNSDVEKIEEHISLEEISSDSNDKIVRPKKKHKKSAPKTAKGIENGDTTKGPEKKQYSVLELLELQARARAIRSQLALEPVTKIELDSDDEGDDGKLTANASNDVLAIAAPETSVAGTVSESRSHRKSIEELEKQMEADKAKEVSTRPVRLKRNFRLRQQDDDDTETEQQNTEKTNVNEAKTTNGNTEETSLISKDEMVSVTEKERSPTPDIIPIIQEPEILCISSSESDGEGESSESKRKYISFPTIVKEKGPPTEDEIFLQKIKEKTFITNRPTDGSKAKESSEIDTATGDGNANTEKENDNQAEEVAEQRKMEALEEGEIIEEETENPDEPAEKVEISSDSSGDSSSDEQESNGHKSDGNKSDAATKSEERKKSVDGAGDDDDANVSQLSRKTNEAAESSIDDENSQSYDKTDTSGKQMNDGNEGEKKRDNEGNDDDDDEDIIDLGKDEDLDFEIKEAPQLLVKEMTNNKTSSRKADKRSTKKMATLEPLDDSWDKRWLRGKKVTTVLATSKLASKVRSKIKEKKSKEKQTLPEEPIAEPKEPVIEEIPSNVEVGSVEHYKEIVKRKRLN